MPNNSYVREIIVSSSPGFAYQTLTSGFEHWWTPASRSISALNDMVTFKFNPTYWTMRVTKLLPDEYVELECVDAHHIHEGLPSSILKEWKGTKLKWLVSDQGDSTKITFTHEGLTPKLGCYEICETGWDHFFVNSLKNYLNNEKEHRAL